MQSSPSSTEPLVTAIQSFDANQIMSTIVIARLAPGLSDVLAFSPDIEWVEADSVLSTTVMGEPVPISREKALGHKEESVDHKPRKLKDDEPRGSDAARILLQRSTTSAALDRSDQRSLPLNSAYNYVWDASNIDVYVVSTVCS